jgi:hypothetical protein
MRLSTAAFTGPRRSLRSDARHPGAHCPSKTERSRAIQYSLKRWPAVTRSLDDGRIRLAKNAARARTARCRDRPRQLDLRRFGPRRRAYRRHLNPDRNGQAQRCRPTGLARRRPQATTGPSCPTRRRPAPLDLRALASIPAAAFTGRTRLISPIDYSNYEFICTAGSVPPNGVTRQAESPMGRIDSPRLTVAFSGPIKGP